MNELANTGKSLLGAFTRHVSSILTIFLPDLVWLTLWLLNSISTNGKTCGRVPALLTARGCLNEASSWPAATFALFGRDCNSVKFTAAFGMGNTVSCCVSPESSPKLPSRLTAERLEELQASSEVSDDTTVPYLQHISDREVPDGGCPRWVLCIMHDCALPEFVLQQKSVGSFSEWAMTSPSQNNKSAQKNAIDIKVVIQNNRLHNKASSEHL